MQKALLALIALLFVSPLAAHAHVLQYGTVSSEVLVQGDRIGFQTELSQNINVYGLLPEEAFAQYQKYFTSHISIKKNGVECPFTLSYFDPSLDSPHSRFEGEFTCPAPIESIHDLSIRSNLFNDAFFTFDHFLILIIGNSRYELPFSNTAIDFPGSVIPKKLSSTFDYFLIVTADFIRMGLMHIWSGFDHILFLLSVILLARSVKNILFLVTAFTLAHSITLVLAGLGIFTLSSHIVEPTIAATILFVAYRNIQALRSGSGQGAERIPLTFAFGLVHGLGFAGALAETSIPKIFFVPSLITFNVGIEVGQVLILAIALPVLWIIDRSAWRTSILLGFSYGVAALSVLWIITRIFL